MTTETASPNQADASTAFLRAARAGQIDKIISLLEQGVDINISNANGLNAIHLSSKDGHVEVVKELLNRGAAIDAATKKGNTALHIASLAGQEPVVKLLVQSGAQVNIQSQNGFTPLYMAAQENHDGVVKFLLANGANQSLATEDGFTPLAVAMQQGHEKVVAVLLESDTRGRVRLPALHIAAKKDDIKAANLLLENEHNPDVTSKSGFTPLHIAAHYGNEAVATLLLNKGADVNCQAKHNICPLHVAAKWGKENMVVLLCDNGANVEARTKDGLTPLHCAARSGHERVVEVLLDRGAPITSKSKNGLAPLHMAAQGDHTEAARILLGRRAPVDDVTVDYLTALHVAAHCGHAKVAKLLLDRNADANARALNGFTPLHIACKKNRIKVVELLLKYGASIQATTESGLTPLHVAAFMGCMNIVIYLLQHEANPDIPTVRGETPLHLAARANQTDIIRILLRNGAAVDAKARERQTPLHIASRLGNVDIAVLLLQHGADVSAATVDHYQPLHIAAKQNNHDVAAALIEHGAPLTATTKKGFTPLHLAAKYGNIKVANLLLAHGASPEAGGKNGVTPLHLAAHHHHHHVAAALLEKGASAQAVAKNGHTPLHIAARKNQIETAAALLEYGAMTNAESKAGFTPLHLAAQQGHTEMCSLLLEHGADVNQQSNNGLSALHLAAQEDRVPVTQLLVKNGGQVDICTKGGYTPLHVASHYGQTNMVRSLIDNGASVKAQTTHGYTALHHAAQQGHINIVNILLENDADANAATVSGQTPLDIASKLGYVTIMETLKSVSDPSSAPVSQEKYKVVAPETMYETFMSDSEEEGGEEAVLNEQPYRYLTADDMKSLGDDSLPIDVTRDERSESALGQRNIMETSTGSMNGYGPTEPVVKSISRYSTANAPEGYCYTIDPNMPNFLVSLVVDARGGAYRGARGGGVRLVLPPGAALQPTRITCRYLKPSRINHMPPLMEGEALAARVLEMGPVAAKFLGPVILEVPHYASLRGKEREIVILRSDNGTSWREHNIDATDEMVQDILTETLEIEESNEEPPVAPNPRVIRILTHDFPQYFAVISRIRQEVHAIGPEGGMVSSSVVPQVQAVFPQGALTKKIKVGLQAQIIDSELTAKLLGRGVAVSPVVTVEPRRRKFHKAITLSMPAPRPHTQGMTNQYSTSSAPTLRLLCSISGGTNRAHWEDVTENTPLTFVNDCVSFTTTVSARYWLIDCRHVEDATKMATELYREAIHVPFMARFIVYAKRTEPQQAQVRMFCVTDDKEEKALERIERFMQTAKSRDVEVHEGKSCYLEFAGNLVPVAKSGEQLTLPFRAFRENRLAFPVMVKDTHTDPMARCQFMREPKVPKGEPSPPPICVLNIMIPEEMVEATIEKPVTPIIAKRSEDQDLIWKQRLSDPRLEDICNLLGKDWVALAYELGVSVATVNQIQAKRMTAAEQAQLMLKLWKTQSGTKAQDNSLELALCRIGRDDIIAPQSEVSNERRIQRNIYQEKQASEEIEAYKAEEDNKLKDKAYEEHQLLEQIHRESDHDQDEAKYSPEEKFVHDKPEIERTPSPSESEEDEDVKRSVAERKEQITRKLSSSKIPASKQKKEIREEIIEIKTQIKPDIKKFHDIEQEQKVKEKDSKLERKTSKTSPESVLEEPEPRVEETKAHDKPTEQFKKFDPSSPAKPTPKHLQRHVRNDSMRFPSGDFSSVVITPKKSVPSETTDVSMVQKEVLTKESISQKEIERSKVEERQDDGDKSPDLIEDDKDIAEAPLKDKITSFESKMLQESSIEIPKTVKLTKEALKKHTMEHSHGIQYTQEFVLEQSQQITSSTSKTVKESEDKIEAESKSVKQTIQRFDSKTKTGKESKPMPSRTDSTLVQVSSEEDSDFLKKSTESDTDIDSKIAKYEVSNQISSDSKVKDTRAQDKFGDKKSKIPRRVTSSDEIKDDQTDSIKDEKVVKSAEKVISKKISKEDLVKTTKSEARKILGKVESQISTTSTISDLSLMTKTNSLSLSSDSKDIQLSQEIPVPNDELIEKQETYDKILDTQVESDIPVRVTKQTSVSPDSSLIDKAKIPDSKQETKDLLKSESTTKTTKLCDKDQTSDFLKSEIEHSGQIHSSSLSKAESEKSVESPVISAKARQFIETVPEDDSVQECFFSKRIYSDSLEDSENTDSRRHSEAESLKSDQSENKQKISSSDFDERAEYEENIDSGSGFGDEKFEETVGFTSIQLHASTTQPQADSDSDIIEPDVIFKKMTPKCHSRNESVSITNLGDLQDSDAKKHEFQMVITEAEDLDRSLEKDDSSDKISSESSRAVELSDRKSSVSDKISSEDAVTDKKTSSEEDVIKESETFLHHEKALSSAVKETKGRPGETKTTKEDIHKKAVTKRQSVTSTGSTAELRLDEKRLSDAHSLTESKDYTFEESEDDIVPSHQVDVSKEKIETKLAESKMSPVKVEVIKHRLSHGDSLDDVEGFPEDHVMEHVHKLPNIAEVGNDKGITSEILTKKEQQNKIDQNISTVVFDEPSQSITEGSTSFYTKDVETTYSINRSDVPVYVKSIIKDAQIGFEENIEINQKTETEKKFDVSKIRADTLSNICLSDGKKTPKDLNLKEVQEISKDQIKPVIDDIIQTGSMVASTKSPNSEKIISKDIFESEKRSYDAKAPQKDERRHSCISPAISLERIAESDVETDEELPQVASQHISITPKSEIDNNTEMKKSDSAMKQMADNIEIIIKQASEEVDVSLEEPYVAPTQSTEQPDTLENVSVDSIIEEAVTTVEEYLVSNQEKQREIELKKEIVYEETKKFAKERPSLMKSLSRDSGEVVIMPKKKQPRTFSVQSSPEEVEEQIYTDSESDMDKAKVLEIIEPSSELEGKSATSTFDARKIRTDSLDDADDLFPEKESEYFGEQALDELSQEATKEIESTEQPDFKISSDNMFKKSHIKSHVISSDIISKSTSESSATTVVSTLTKTSDEQKSLIEEGTSADFSKMSGADLARDPSKASIDMKEEFHVEDRGTPDLSKKSIDLTKDYSKSSIDSKDTSRDFATNELSKDSTVDLSKDFSKASIESVRDISKSIDEKTFSEDQSLLDVSKTLASDISEAINASKELIDQEKVTSTTLTENKTLSRKEGVESTNIDLISSQQFIKTEDEEIDNVPDMKELNRRCSNLLEEIQGTTAQIRIDSSYVTQDIKSKFSTTPPPSPVDLTMKVKTEDIASDKLTGLHPKGSDSLFLDASHSPRASSAGDSVMSETDAHHSDLAIQSTSSEKSVITSPKTTTFIKIDQPHITSGAQELVDRTIEKSIDVIDQIKKEQEAIQKEELQKSTSKEVIGLEKETEKYTDLQKTVSNSSLKFQSIDPQAVMSDLIDKFGSKDEYTTVLTHTETATRKNSGQEFFSEKQQFSSDDDSLIIKTETSHELRGQEHETKEKKIVKKEGDSTETSEMKVERGHEASARRSEMEIKTVFKSTDDTDIITVEREFTEQGLYTGRQSKSEEKMTEIKEELTKKKNEVKISERDLSHEQWGKEYFTEPGELENINEDEDSKTKISFFDSNLKIIEKDEVLSSEEVSEKGKVVSSKIKHHKDESVIESKEHDDISSDASHAPSFRSETVDRQSSTTETSPKSKSKSFKKENEVYEVDFIKEIKVSTSPVKSTFSRTGSQDTHSESEVVPDLPHDDKTDGQRIDLNKSPLKNSQQKIQNQVWEVSVQKIDSFETVSDIQKPHCSETTTATKSFDSDTILELPTVVESKTAVNKYPKTDMSPSTNEISDDISTTSNMMVKSGESIDTELMVKSLESHEGEVLQKSIDSTVSAETLHPSEFSTDADSAFLTGTDHRRDELKLVKEKSLEDICSSGYDTDLSSAEFHATKLESERVDFEALMSAQPLADLSVLEKTIDEVKQSIEAAQVEIITEKNDGSSKYKQSPSEFQFKLLISPDRPEVITEEPQHAEDLEKNKRDNTEQTRQTFCQISESSSQKASSIEESTLSEDKITTVHLKESSPPLDSSEISGKSDSGPHSILETESEIIFSDRELSSKSSPEVKLRINKHIKSKVGVGDRRSASEVEGWSSSGESHYQSFDHSESRPLSSDVDVMMTAQSGTDFETALTSHDVSSTSLKTSKEFYTASSSIASRDSMKSLDSDGSSHVASIDISDASETLVPSANELKEELMESSTYVEQFMHETDIKNKTETVVSDEDTSENEDNQQISSEDQLTKMKRSHEMRFQPKDLIPDNFPIESVSENTYKDVEEKDVSYTSKSEIECKKKEIKEDIIKSNIHDEHAVPFSVSKFEQTREFSDIESEIIPTGSLEYEQIIKSKNLIDNSKKYLEEESTIIKATIHQEQSILPSGKGFKQETEKEFVKKHIEEVTVVPFPVTKISSQREFVDVEDQIIIESSLQHEEILKSKSDSAVLKSKVKTPDSDQSKKSSSSSLKLQEHTSTSHTPVSIPSENSLSTDNGREYVLDDIYDISETPELKSDLLTEGTSSRSELIVTTEDKTLHHDEKQDSPTSDEFEIVDKPGEIDDFVVIEEVAREAHESDTEGKSLVIKTQKYVPKHDVEVEEMLSKTSKKQDCASSASESLSDEEILQYELEQKRLQAQELAEIEAGKRWVQMQFEGDPRYDYERVPLEDIKEEEMTDFDASRIGSLSSQKESVGSFGSFRNSYGSMSESEMASRIRFRVKGENDDVSISSLQEFENLEKALMEQYQQHSSSSQDSLNGSLPKRYKLGKSQGDDISISSLKEFEGLESACIEALKAEILAKQKEALLVADPKDVTGCFLEQEKKSYSGSSESSPPQKSGSPSQKGSYGSPSQKNTADSATIRKLIEQQMALEQMLQDRLKEKSSGVTPKVVTVKKFDDRGAFFVPEPETRPIEAPEVIEECKKESTFICATGTKDGSVESIPGDCEEMMKILEKEEESKTVTELLTKTSDKGKTEVTAISTVVQQQFIDGKKVSEVITTSDGTHAMDIPGAHIKELESSGSISIGSEISSSMTSQQSDLDSLVTVVEQHSESLSMKPTGVLSSDRLEELEFDRADSLMRELSPSSGFSVAHSFVSASGKPFTDPASGSWSGQDEDLSSSGSFSKGARADLMLGSTDSLEATSSNATRATYNYEVDTPLTGSLTSGGSNTMVSSLDTMDPLTAVHMDPRIVMTEHYAQEYEVHEPDSDTERLELDGRAPRAKERTIMFDSTDTLSAVSGDGSVREAVVETPAATFYIGDTPIVRGEKEEDDEEGTQQLSGSCPASLPPTSTSSPPVPAQRSCYCLSHSSENIPKSLSMLAKSPPSSIEDSPKK